MKQLNYNMITYTIDTDKGIEWIAEFPTLVGVVGSGNTIDIAIEDLYEEARIHLDFLEEEKIPIPNFDKPLSIEKYSGKILLRTSSSLHEQLKKSAESDGVTLNMYLNILLSRNNACEDVKGFISSSLSHLFDLLTKQTHYLIDKGFQNIDNSNRIINPSQHNTKKFPRKIVSRSVNMQGRVSV